MAQHLKAKASWAKVLDITIILAIFIFEIIFENINQEEFDASSLGLKFKPVMIEDLGLMLDKIWSGVWGWENTGLLLSNIKHNSHGLLDNVYCTSVFYWTLAYVID